MPEVQERDSLSTRLVSLDTFRGLVMLLMVSDGLRSRRSRAVALSGQSYLAVFGSAERSRSLAGLHALGSHHAGVFVDGGHRAAVLHRKPEATRAGECEAVCACRVAFDCTRAARCSYYVCTRAARSGLNFINVLVQIGLGYWFVFLLAERSFRVQAVATFVRDSVRILIVVLFVRAASGCIRLCLGRRAAGLASSGRRCGALGPQHESIGRV